MDESINITEHASRMILGILKILEDREILGDNVKIHFDPDLLGGLIEDIENKQFPPISG